MQDVGGAQTLNFKDRHLGLIIAGIILIVLGLGCALLIPLCLVSVLMAPHMHSGYEVPSVRFIVPCMVILAGTAVAFVWLGIGSIMCRRWARALILALSCMGFVGGVISTLAQVIYLPATTQIVPPGVPVMPEQMRIVFTIITIAFCMLLYVLLPGSLALFYRTFNVKATCESRDPVARWTDRLPLPVLMLCLVLAASTAMTPLLLCYNSAVPVFGSYVSGLPGTMLIILACVLNAICCFNCLKLKPIGWWMTVGVLTTTWLSYLSTIVRLGLMPWYQLMGMPAQQLLIIEKMDIMHTPLGLAFMLLSALPYLWLVGYTRRYFIQGKVDKL